MEEILTGTEAVDTTPAGENEQERAEPAPDTAGQGENGQGTEEIPNAEPAPAGQTPEENAAFAAARRRAEAQAAQRMQAEKDALVQRMLSGQINPYTNRPFSTEAEYNDYLQRFEAEQRDQQLQQAGLDANLLNRMIENNPAVQQARQMTARMQQQEGQRALEAQPAEIAKLDPSVTDMATLVKHPNFADFDARVRQGYSLIDAFKLANYDQLTGKKPTAANQQALNAVNGENDLNATKGAGSGEDIVVPEETMESYRRFFPNWTKQQIIEDYTKPQ